jgi:hypothetical protein
MENWSISRPNDYLGQNNKKTRISIDAINGMGTQDPSVGLMITLIMEAVHTSDTSV